MRSVLTWMYFGSLQDKNVPTSICLDLIKEHLIYRLYTFGIASTSVNVSNAKRNKGLINRRHGRPPSTCVESKYETCSLRVYTSEFNHYMSRGAQEQSEPVLRLSRRSDNLHRVDTERRNEEAFLDILITPNQIPDQFLRSN